jgi:hypothetical protein
LLANAKQGESTLPGGWGGSLLALSWHACNVYFYKMCCI